MTLRKLDVCRSECWIVAADHSLEGRRLALQHADFSSQLLHLGGDFVQPQLQR